MVRSKKIIDDMKVEVTRDLASFLTDRELNEKYIIPAVFDKRCARVISEEFETVVEYLGLAQNPGNREW